MKKTTKSKTSTTTTRKSTKSVKALYPVSRLTKKSSANLWVTFPAGSPAKGLVFSSVLTRDTVRNATAKLLGVHMNDIRSRRVSSYRKVSK